MYYEDYFDEPNEFEQQISEFKDSLINSVKDEHKAEIQRLREENARLSAIEHEMQESIKKNKNELNDIERRKINLKSEVESEFYSANLDDVIMHIGEQWEVWYAECISYEQPKCELCNDERQQIAVFPNGKISTMRCDCANNKSVYEPEFANVTYLKISKRDSRYRSDRHFYITKSYDPNPNSRSSRDDYNYREWGIQHVVDVFCEETKALHQEKGYGKKIAFTSKSECQKYCDWINEKKAVQNG